MSHPIRLSEATRLDRRVFLSGMTGALSLLGLRAADAPPSRTRPPVRDMAALEKLIASMANEGPPWLAVPPAEGRLLKLMAGAVRAHRALEIGTAHGYAAMWLAAGLEETGGRLITIEILAERVVLARRHVEAAGLNPLVTFKEGDAHKILATLDGPFDLVYLNADKDGLPDYFRQLFPNKLSSSALLVVYGAIKQREKMQSYLDMIMRREDFTTVVVSATLEDGFCLSLRRSG